MNNYSKKRIVVSALMAAFMIIFTIATFLFVEHYSINALTRENEVIIRLIFAVFVIAELIIYAIYIIWMMRTTQKGVESQKLMARKLVDAENKAVINALSDDFDYVCYIDIVSNTVTRFYASEQMRGIIEGIDVALPSNRRLDKFLNTLILPEDRDKFLEDVDREYMMRKLKRNKNWEVKFRVTIEEKVLYYALKFAADTKNSRGVIMGLYSIDEATRKEIESKKIEKQIKQINEIVARFAERYDSVYIIDMENDRITSLKQSKDVRERYGEPTSYFDFTDSYIKNDVYEYDRALMSIELSKSNMKERTDKESAYSVKYRDISSGYPRWYELSVTSMDDYSQLLIGITDKHSEIVRAVANKKIFGDMTAIYVVNLDENRLNAVKLFKSTEGYEQVSQKVYTSVIRSMSAKVEEGFREFFDKFEDPMFVKAYLSDCDRREFSFATADDNGNRIWLKCNLYVEERRDSQASVVVFTFTTVDDEQIEKLKLNAKIAEQKAQLEQALLLAQAASEAKTTFLFSMSHDIRTPMNAITGYTKMAKKYMNDSSKVKDCLDKIDISGQQLLALINQVLEMSRIESGKIELQEKEVDIIENASAMLTTSGVTVKEHGIELITDFSKVSHRFVRTDPERVNQICINILGNAVKYTPSGGTISFSISEESGIKENESYFIYTIEDTGIGMSKEYLDHIFDEFSRERTSTVSGIQGTGLGMSIVKRLVKMIRGKIKIESEKNKGTKVMVSIPMCYTEKASLSESENEEKNTEVIKFDLAGRRILLVEDNELNREIAKELLESEGLIVDEAVDGSKAVSRLALMGSEYYDAILIDIQMPVMNGYEATARIRELYPDKHISIIALSANAFEEDVAKSKAAGMDDHVAKPIVLDQLRRALRKAIARNSSSSNKEKLNTEDIMVQPEKEELRKI